MYRSNWISKLSKVFATSLIAAGFGGMSYIFAIQARYLQPSYLLPHPESGRVVPYMFKGLVRYLTPNEEMIFSHGFYVSLALLALGGVWKQSIKIRNGKG